MMVITTSLKKGNVGKAKEYAKKNKGKFIPRGRKSFLELVETARYYGADLIILENKMIKKIKILEKGWRGEYEKV